MLINIERNIKKIRELKNFTQEYVATELGITSRAYSKIESGETKLTIDRINKISQIFEIQVETIMNFDEKQILTGNITALKIDSYDFKFPLALIEQYEARILQLKAENKFLKRQITCLLR